MSRFSKLKKEIEKLFDPKLDMQFCCNAYPMRSKTGYAKRSLPRFYVKIGKDIIWDFPKDFEVEPRSSDWCSLNGISALVREYIDTPVAELLDKEFSGEFEHRGNFGTGRHKSFVIRKSDMDVVKSLTDIFKTADRRVGKQKLYIWAAKSDTPQVEIIMDARFTPQE